MLTPNSVSLLCSKIRPQFLNPLSNLTNPKNPYKLHIRRILLRRFSIISRFIMAAESNGFSNGGGPADSRASTLANGEDRGHFRLSPVSVMKIQKGDITQWFVDGSSDAIVNPANERMLGGGGADGAIHRAAGPELRAACYNVPEVRPGVRCPTGEARITPNSLRVARENNIQYVAFTAISCGVYGYPYDEAASVAISSVREFANDFKEVHFVLFSDDIYNVWLNKANELLQN
ncbi:hypothetical protein RJ640_026261 [Escallonia rubra]|uniref:Macro domain-containing protein n=1 Tax=Escallonia rubra TaxID=112253 RepID=A0AA88RA87_9ASTE|nr:hypothetical protein RJ640_026261 [Escallonia rubra]